MLPIYDNLTIQHIVEETMASGIEDINHCYSRHENLLKAISTSTMNLNISFKRQEKTMTRIGMVLSTI